MSVNAKTARFKQTQKAKAILLLCNCQAETEAREIAAALVEQSLAAAVQIIGPSQSFYRWQDEVCEHYEWLLVIKTSTTRYTEIEALIAARHNYELPGILQLDIAAGEGRYLDWILQNSAGIQS